MTEMCRCGRDLHPSPLRRKVAQFYADHAFDADYDPDTDDSPIVCPGSYTEWPLLATNITLTGSWQITGSFLDDITTTFYTWMPEWYGGTFQQDSTYTFSSPGYFKIHAAPPWVTYDESPAKKAYKAISKMAATLESLTCEKSDTVIEFGPKNWPVEPMPTWSIWQPWHVDVPPIYSDCWRESIQLPDLPVDYQKVAEEFNEKQVSFPGVPGKYSFSKLIGV